MPKQKLSALVLPTLPEGDYVDQLVPGLNITVGKKRRTWTLRHRVAGRQRRDVLGHYPLMGLAEARNAARALAERIETGAPIKPAPVHPRSRTLTLGELIDRYETHRRVKGGHGTKSLDEAMRHTRRGLADYLAMPANTFGKNELRAARDTMAKTAPVASNRLLAYTSPILAWAAREDLIEVDFARSVVRVGKETKRKRILSHGEIRCIWQSCERLGPTPASRSYGCLIQFLLVTGQRRDEAAGLRHGHIYEGVWRQSVNKADRPHAVPLPPLAQKLVGEGQARDLVFSGREGTQLSGWSKFKRRLDVRSGVVGWTVHDLRRTAASGWQDAGADYLTIEALLNHALPGVSAVYMRAEMQVQKAEVLRKWATQIEQIVAENRVSDDCNNS